MPFASTCLDRGHRPARHAIGALAIVACAVAPLRVAADAPAAQPGVFRSLTELVVLQVSVTDANGKFVPDLTASDFAVFEEGRQQTISLFSTSTAPLDLMLLMDTSASMNTRIGLARQAASRLTGTLRPEDRAAFVTFSDRVRVVQALTHDKNALDAAIRDATPRGGTALHEALYIALRDLSVGRRDEGRRQALVVLSDGEDTMSRSVSFDDVLAEARRGGVTVFAIVPAAPDSVRFEPAPRGQTADFRMRTLAQETGGRLFATSRDEELENTYMQIAEELGRQYWLAYMPTPAGSGYRRVSVRVVTQPVLRARTRTGYVARPVRSVLSTRNITEAER
jgi:Ca-activated chloride channel family protein